MMKSLLAIVVALVSISGVVLADTTGSAQADVYVQVVENVSVGVITPLVNLGSVQTGPVRGDLTFRVDANVQLVGLYVSVSNLYKDNVPTSVWQIPVDLDAGVLVVNQDVVKEQPAGSDNILRYQAAATVGPYLGQMTETGQFSAGQNGHFSEDVVVRPAWVQPDPELPTGEYSGLVVFTAVL